MTGRATRHQRRYVSDLHHTTTATLHRSSGTLAAARATCSNFKKPVHQLDNRIGFQLANSAVRFSGAACTPMRSRGGYRSRRTRYYERSWTQTNFAYGELHLESRPIRFVHVRQPAERSEQRPVRCWLTC